MRKPDPTAGRPQGRPRLTGWIALAAGVALVGGFAAFAAPAAEDEPPAYSAFNGQQTYKTLCSNCHGVKGEGDGYLVESLLKRPTDLTTLAQRHDGKYPADKVASYVDGREEVREHGRREMPIWGDALLWPEEESPERRGHVQRKIGELVEFLRTIQKPATEPPPSGS